MPFFQAYLLLGLLILALMTLMWLISLPIKNSSIVDIFWGTGFVITAWSAFFITPDGPTVPKLLICTLATIWGFRLSVHIFIRNHGKPEDFRYQKWRQEAGRTWWFRSYFRVFLLQGVLMWIISIPLLAAQMAARDLFWLDYIAAAIWLFGFYFEAAGDAQLARFRANPANKGKVLSSGVWKYTRHPNYFGDAAQWWGFYLIAAASGGWWTIFSPVLMTLFLMRVSGVTLLEKTLSTEKPGYRDYMETTSEFIPWPPKRK
jgi:steroid 5-alpha reductase family enzyme